MIIREAPTVRLRFIETPTGERFLQHAMLEEDTETGERKYVWEYVTVHKEECYV